MKRPNDDEMQNMMDQLGISPTGDDLGSDHRVSGLREDVSDSELARRMRQGLGGQNVMTKEEALSCQVIEILSEGTGP